jgi:hypothetical protein
MRVVPVAPATPIVTRHKRLRNLSNSCSGIFRTQMTSPEDVERNGGKRENRALTWGLAARTSPQDWGSANCRTYPSQAQFPRSKRRKAPAITSPELLLERNSVSVTLVEALGLEPGFKEGLNLASTKRSLQFYLARRTPTGRIPLCQSVSCPLPSTGVARRAIRLI